MAETSRPEQVDDCESVRPKPRLSDGEFERLVQAMSNWRRNRWARAGYPGLRRRDLAALKRHLDLDQDTATKRVA